MVEFVIRGQYPATMTVSAHDVAAVLRERLPGLPTLKLHKLLYYVQGHHLAALDAALFGGPSQPGTRVPLSLPCGTRRTDPSRRRPDDFSPTGS
jgi:hypothetical protein